MKTALLLFCALCFPKLLLGSGMITGVVLPNAKALSEFFPKDQIRMDLAYDHTFSTLDAKGSLGDIWIYCRWTNIEKKEVKLLVKDHDDFQGTLDYPWGIKARMTSKSGKSTDWVDSSGLCSQISHIRPGDIVALEPGESLVRRVPLAEIVGQFIRKPGGPDVEGDFTVEMRLGEIVSKTILTLHLERKEMASQAPEAAR